MNVLHIFIEEFLPYPIAILDIIGILVVFWTGISASWKYFRNVFFKKHFNVRQDLAKGLAMGLHFMMGAEILQTLTAKTAQEVHLLVSIILIRATLSFLLHFGLNPHKKLKSDLLGVPVQSNDNKE